MGFYVRFQSPTKSDGGTRVGVFGLVNSLGKRGLLSEEDERLRRQSNSWFDAAYTDPSTVDGSVYDSQVNPMAAAWFKSGAAAHLVDATLQHCVILDRYSVPWERVESDDPGRVLYDDDHQIVVVPHPP